MKIVKKVEQWQWERLRAWPQSVKPNGLEYAGGNIWYDFVPGFHPTDGNEMHRALARSLWGSLPTGHGMPIDRNAYWAYIIEIVERDPLLEIGSIRDALDHLLVDELTPVADYHGDATNQNVIVLYDTMIHKFIDPGHHRGLPCRELDEAKMLQSAEGFCEMYRGIPRLKWTVSPSRVQLVLLMTHYIRLLRHVKCERSLNFARKRIKDIANLW